MYPNWVHPFLVNLERTGNVSKSARLSGITSDKAYYLRDTDASFKTLWHQAIEDHTDRCEEELTRRAFGYEEPVVYQGQLTPVWQRDAHGEVIQYPVEVLDSKGEVQVMRAPRQARNPDGTLQWLTVTKFSDALLLARVKAYRKRYSTERTELTGADGGAVATTSTARAARVAHLLDLAQRRKDDATELSDFA